MQPMIQIKEIDVFATLIPAIARRSSLIIGIALTLAAGCTNFSPIRCGDIHCPLGTACAAAQDICIRDSCGNGQVDHRVGEVCDDGNLVDGDGCSRDCRSDERCGNGVLDTVIGEVCDDGNQLSGDGCRADCQSDERCGNGVIDSNRGEVCDDGNNDNDDACSSDCRVLLSCGNGVLDPDELEVDCGGRCMGSCKTGQTCEEDSDCMLGHCQNARCAQGRITGGERHTCVVRDNGGLRCWGHNSDWQLGYASSEDIGDDEIPASAGDVPVGESVLQVISGVSYTCALLTSDTVRCWGNSMVSSTPQIPENSTPLDIGGTVIQIAGGREHACALLDTNSVRCWGDGNDGQLGRASIEDIPGDGPVQAHGNVAVGSPVAQIAAGDVHTCALLIDGNVRCWGNGSSGQLGYGNTETIGDNEVPAYAGDVPIGSPVLQIAAGGEHTCALLDGGQVRCWGNGEHGQLGYGAIHNIGDDETPASMGDVPVGGRVIQIAAGYSHTCALLDSGNLRCWGGGSSDHDHDGETQGHLGYGIDEQIGDDELPSSAGDVPVGGTVFQVATGNYHTCALLADDALRCWGNHQDGRLGYPNITGDIGDTETPASFPPVNYQ